MPDDPAHRGKLRSADGSWWSYAPEPGYPWGPRWNLGHFFDPDSATEDRSAILQALCDAIHVTGGGELHHPGGVIRASRILFHRNTAFTGIAGRSIFRRIADKGRFIFKNAGSRDGANIHVERLIFDLDTAEGRGLKAGQGDDFATGIQINGSDADGLEDRAISIEDCTFINSGAARAGQWTLTGITLQGVGGARVERIVSDGCQLKLAGGSQTTRNLILRQLTSRNARAYGLSVVVDSGGRLENIELRDITIENPGRGGIFLGTDGGNDVSTTSVHNLLVENAVVRMGDLALMPGEPANFAFKYAGAGDEDGVVFRNVRVERPPARKNLREGYSISLIGPQADVVLDNCAFDGFCEVYAIAIYGRGHPRQSFRMTGGGAVGGEHRGVLVQDVAEVRLDDVTLGGTDPRGQNRARLHLKARRGNMHVVAPDPDLPEPVKSVAKAIDLATEGHRITGRIAGQTLDFGGQNRPASRR